MNCLIITEGGSGIGFGHLSRCIAIRNELLFSGHTAQIVAELRGISRLDSQIIELNWLGDPIILKRFTGYDLLLIDSYLLNREDLETINRLFKKTVIIDDYNRIKYEADLLINPNVFFKNIDYSNQTCPRVGGADYVILRKEFRKNSQQISYNRNVANLLVSIGGSDFRQLIPQLIDIFLSTSLESINIVAPEGLNSDLDDNRLSILGCQSAYEMCELMSKADLVVSACGQSLHELASLGKPVIGICLADDQEPNQDFYFKAGFLKDDIKWDTQNLKERLLDNLNYFAEFEAREEVGRLGKNLINRNGVSNLTNKLTTLFND